MDLFRRQCFLPLIYYLCKHILSVGIGFLVLVLSAFNLFPLQIGFFEVSARWFPSVRLLIESFYPSVFVLYSDGFCFFRYNSGSVYCFFCSVIFVKGIHYKIQIPSGSTKITIKVDKEAKPLMSREKVILSPTTLQFQKNEIVCPHVQLHHNNPSHLESSNHQYLATQSPQN